MISFEIGVGVEALFVFTGAVRESITSLETGGCSLSETGAVKLSMISCMVFGGCGAAPEFFSGLYMFVYLKIAKDKAKIKTRIKITANASLIMGFWDLIDGMGLYIVKI